MSCFEVEKMLGFVRFWRSALGSLRLGFHGNQVGNQSL
jgi:hypothetical protein